MPHNILELSIFAYLLGGAATIIAILLRIRNKRVKFTADPSPTVKAVIIGIVAAIWPIYWGLVIKERF